MHRQLCILYCRGSTKDLAFGFAAISNQACQCIRSLLEIVQVSGRYCNTSCAGDGMQICGGPAGYGSIFNVSMRNMVILAVKSREASGVEDAGNPPEPSHESGKFGCRKLALFSRV